MKLSILIRTIVGREDKFERLSHKLHTQRALTKNFNWQYTEVEILHEKDNKQTSVGAKAQRLIERATGDFVCFVDDDDDVPDYYIAELLNAIDNNPDIDCIGFKIECYGIAPNGEVELASASNRWDRWAENVGGFRYVRTIYHKTPVRREHALAIGYKDLRFAEDHDYSKRLKESGLLKKEVFIDKVMYFYNYKYEAPKTKYNL